VIIGEGASGGALGIGVGDKGVDAGKYVVLGYFHQNLVLPFFGEVELRKWRRSLEIDRQP